MAPVRPDYDIVIFGATSFVGQILVHYLWQQYGDSDNRLRWALAGRSREKLEKVRESLAETFDTRASDLPLLVADARDDEALASLCRATRVVVSTVGPYALYGEPLVRACIDQGTDYCDLSGEVQWMRRMITRHGEAAQRSGARLIHSCGFDSIPSDMGVFFLQQEARARYGKPATRVRMRVEKSRGSLSGGTIASLVNVVREAAGSRALRKELSNPYSLCPPDHGFRERQPVIQRTRWDRSLQRWTAPFFMAAVNTRVVLRTHALNHKADGPDFLYDEAILLSADVKGWMRAWGITIATRLFTLAVSIRPSRALLEKYVLPAPGEGPDPEARARGHFSLLFVGETGTGERLVTRVTGDRDPGYGATAKMLGEAAVCLATDPEVRRLPGGFWTPATAFRERLLARLQQNAGMTFERVDSPE